MNLRFQLVMKKPLFYFLVINLSFSGFLVAAQNSKEQSFKKTLNQVVSMLIHKDTAGIIQFIDLNTGVFIITRPGVYDTYTNHKAVNFSKNGFPFLYIAQDIKACDLKYGTLPEYSCEYERWSKTGCYVDTTKTDHLLSNTAKSLVQYLELEISEKTITEFIELESITRRVVIVSQDGNSLILYLSYIKNKWYLSIIDQVTGDCSA
jgi:hypothetical protein